MPKIRAVLIAAAVIAVSVAGLAGQGGGGGRGGGAGQAPGGVVGGRGAAGQARQGGPGGRGAVRDATAQTTVGTAAISGMVVVEGSGAPVRRARVSLSGAELRGARSVITDDQGRFTLTALPAGRFTMTASKPGFVDNTYGAKRAGRPGTAIQLQEGQKLDRAIINLPRGGVITGVVVDDHGEPAAGTQVRALRYVIRTGERTLQQAGQDTADDRGVYRIYQLQPGDYIVNAVPRNMTAADVRTALTSELSLVVSRLQSSGINVAGAGGRGLDPATAVNSIVSGGELGNRLAELQGQLATLDQEQNVAYAPVYYPGTTEAPSAATVTVGVAEERTGVDFRLQLVPTARVTGLVASPAGTPNGTQVALVPADRAGMPSIPGLTSITTRVGPDGRFTFNNVTPGQYQLQARATIREVVQATPVGGDQAAAAGRQGGRGGQGGGRNITQVLWAVSPVDVAGQNPPDIVLNLQPGMTVGGRVVFPSLVGESPDPSRVRVSLSPRGSQSFEIGGGALTQVQADASGAFSIVGVAPGRYTVSATMAAAGGRGAAGLRGQGPVQGAGPAAGGRAGGRAGGAGSAGAPGTATANWTLESATVDGRDILDFPIEIGPNQNVTGMQLTFTDKRQELSGTIQDASGRPLSDFTIIVYPPDSRYWLPQARRIASGRPGTDGRFSFSSLPAGDYRLAAVTDVEPGEWYDPAFLTQMNALSLPLTIQPGERKVQDIRLAGQ